MKRVTGRTRKKGERQMARVWRQGDVIVREVSEIPKNAVRRETNEIRIASETGNPHSLRATQVFETRDRGRSLQSSEQFALLEEPALMTHPQHPSLQLPIGIYRITTMRDYAPARRLMD
jgi:hypothetical protein